MTIKMYQKLKQLKFVFDNQTFAQILNPDSHKKYAVFSQWY